MSLDAALSIAVGGLTNVNRHMALVSQNVANASTPDYVAEVATQESLTAGSMSLGVRTGAATRHLDAYLQAAVFAQDGTVAGLDTTAAALGAIDAKLGTPGQGDDLPSLVGVLRDRFSALMNTPQDQTQQVAVVTAAQRLARQINGLSDTYTTQRQGAHDDIRAALTTLNGSLQTIGTLSAQIVALKAGCHSTADLENQRDAALHTVAGLVSVKALVQASGEMLVVTTSGLALPTRSGMEGLQLDPANLLPGTAYPGTVPAITLRGQDVTGQMQGGRIGADIVLRDRTMPTFQAELDEFARTLASRFDAQGLTLFTDTTGAVPAAGAPPVQAAYVGFARTIEVNGGIVANPSQVRDGTTAIAGSPTGASAFTPNPSGGPAGFTTLIARVLDHAFGAEAQPGVSHPVTATSGLGVNGDLTAPYAAPSTLADHATALVAAQSQESSDVAARLQTESAYRDGLASRLSAGSAVSMDAEMSRMLSLQTAYAANARIMSVVQALFGDLISALR